MVRSPAGDFSPVPIEFFRVFFSFYRWELWRHILLVEHQQQQLLVLLLSFLKIIPLRERKKRGRSEVIAVNSRTLTHEGTGSPITTRPGISSSFLSVSCGTHHHLLYSIEKPFFLFLKKKNKKKLDSIFCANFGHVTVGRAETTWFVHRVTRIWLFRYIVAWTQKNETLYYHATDDECICFVWWKTKIQ